VRIILFCIPEFGSICLNTLLSANKNVVAVVLPPASHPARNGMKFIAESLGVPTIHVEKRLKDPVLIDEIKSYKPDIGLIASYPRLIPPEIYTIPPLNIINCHPSMLPDYRGPNPYFHVIKDGLKETGISFHYLDDTFDTGDLIFQTPFKLYSDDTLGTMFIRISIEASKIYLKILEKLEQGETFVAVPQSETTEDLVYASEVTHESPDLQIKWYESSFIIDCLVRASNPFYGAYTFYREMPLRIFSGTYEPKKYLRPLASPGTIIKVSKDRLGVATADGIYYPETLQCGLLYITDIKDFIKRSKPKTGEMLN
jgi:methionyl-tRNA formyltransferase